MDNNAKSVFTLLRNGDTENLSNKLIMIARYLYEERPKYKSLISEMELEKRILSLEDGTFSFSSMSRSWIPKPHKPGEMRPITKPHKEDIIVLDALSLLLNIVFERVFLPQSHGFIRRRGPITFFLQMRKWGTLDRLVKADIVK